MYRAERICIGIFSNRAQRRRRQACRDTWLRELRRFPQLDAVFVIGAAGQVESPVRCDDVLLLPCANDDAYLPQRVRRFCQWAVESQTFDYLFKCQDETYVCLERLANYDTRGRAYLGGEESPNCGYASGGAGYLLNRHAAAVVAMGLDERAGTEDVLVGELLRRRGVEQSVDGRFVAHRGLLRLPCPENEIITAYGVCEELASKIYARFQANGASALVAALAGWQS